MRSKLGLIDRLKKKYANKYITFGKLPVHIKLDNGLMEVRIFKNGDFWRIYNFRLYSMLRVRKISSISVPPLPVTQRHGRTVF